MKFIGLSRNKDTEEITRYELKLYRHEISSLYKDRYGCYVCTLQGKIHKVDHTLDELKEEIGL